MRVLVTIGSLVCHARSTSTSIASLSASPWARHNVADATSRPTNPGSLGVIDNAMLGILRLTAAGGARGYVTLRATDLLYGRALRQRSSVVTQDWSDAQMLAVHMLPGCR
jgi:hypothetical protein